MFYRSKEQLKAQLEDRLRTALDFATLGAYEDELEVESQPPAPRPPQTRVFLFAKVATPCPHSPDRADGCDAAGAEAVEHRRLGASGSAVGTRRRVQRVRRGGAAKVAPQPCTWAGS
jgi:hypothetical protein